MKELIHLRVPLDDNYTPIIDYEFARKIRDDIQKYIGDDRIIIVSPFHIESKSKKVFSWTLTKRGIIKMLKQIKR